MIWVSGVVDSWFSVFVMLFEVRCSVFMFKDVIRLCVLVLLLWFRIGVLLGRIFFVLWLLRLKIFVGLVI